MEQVTTLHSLKHIPLILVPKVAANSCSLFQSKLLCWIELQQQSYHDAVPDRNGCALKKTQGFKYCNPSNTFQNKAEQITWFLAGCSPRSWFPQRGYPICHWIQNQPSFSAKYHMYSYVLPIFAARNIINQLLLSRGSHYCSKKSQVLHHLSLVTFLTFTVNPELINKTLVHYIIWGFPQIVMNCYSK